MGRDYIFYCFNTQGGTEIDGISGNGIIEELSLTAPTKEGFTFDGWYKDADCTQVWDFDIDTVSEDTILFAKWKEVVYSVILNTQSGSDVDAISINENGTIDQSSLNVPTKEGFSFAGWYKDANCT